MSKLAEVAKAIKDALKNTGDLVQYGDLSYRNAYQKGKRSLSIALQNVEYTEGQRPIAEATFIIQGSYAGAYDHYTEYLNWLEDVRTALLEDWDDGLEYVMEKDIENIALDVGVYADRGLFVIGLKVRFYNAIRET